VASDLAEVQTGKPLSETRAVDIVTGADVIEYYAGLAVAIEGRQIPLRPTSFVYTRQEPLGVVAGIGAWNYPIQIAMWKSAPALAAGNAMVFKPSEVTPLTTPKLEFASLSSTGGTVGELLDAAHDYFLATGRRVSIEYALIKDMNDHAWRAQLLADELNRRDTGWAHVNPIPLNPTPGSIWTCSEVAVQDMFVDTLRRAVRGL